MADPDEGEAQLGLNSSYNSEEPEATKLFCAKLFWAGEELMDVGGGRFYPSRQAPGLSPHEDWVTPHQFSNSRTWNITLASPAPQDSADQCT